MNTTTFSDTTPKTNSFSQRSHSPALAGFVLVAAVLAGACSSSSDPAADSDPAETTAASLTTTSDPVTTTSDPAAEFYGGWISGFSGYVSLNEDGSWGVSDGPDSDPWTFGTFTFDSGVLTFTTDPGVAVCDAEQTGTYEASITDEGNLDLSVISDECLVRKFDWEQELVPYSG